MFKFARGYSLIELIITIVLTSIVIIAFFNFFSGNQRNSVSSVLQVKATQLGQAILEEVILKKFDEASPSGNGLPCNSPGGSSCSLNLGSEVGEIRATFDDVDDYHALSQSPPQDTLGNILNEFNNFSVNINVTYAGTDFGLSAQDLKLISVTIQSPDSNQYVFSQYKANF